VAYPKTPHIESLGADLIASNFKGEAVIAFVKAVCSWGGYPGIGARVLKRNDLNSISAALMEAHGHIVSKPPAMDMALATLNALSGLGTPSFASKHLRFLHPEFCPVFDSMLQQALPYSFDHRGFAAFAQDCFQIAGRLTEASIPNPRERPEGRWFAADVESS